ncbi:hypothetical protein [Flavivirga aquatica]|uniref:hypothetical protein n=1 Tax=Flavivirga aquatica TaxID=1849968 RepID=UPI000F4EC095|nr:hypothetical protein [Flavivirga aquatica]
MQRKEIVQELKQIEILLKRENKLIKENKSILNPLFIWPVKKVSHITYNEIWAISNYVDHNVAFSDEITDFNGGAKSYDTYSGYNHQGVDIFIWPYSLNMLENNGLEV